MLIEQTKRALGSILNLSRYKAPTTLAEANARLSLIDQIALQALGDLRKTAVSEAADLRLRVVPTAKRERTGSAAGSDPPASARRAGAA